MIILNTAYSSTLTEFKCTKCLGEKGESEGQQKMESIPNSLLNICHFAALIIFPSPTEQYDTSSKTHPDSQQGTS